MSSGKKRNLTIMKVRQPAMTKAFTDTLDTIPGAYGYLKKCDEQKKIPEQLALRYIIEKYFKDASWLILTEETSERERTSALLSLIRDESYAVDDLLAHTNRRVSNGSWQSACTKSERVHILRYLLCIFCRQYGYAPHVTVIKQRGAVQPH